MSAFGTSGFDAGAFSPTAFDLGAPTASLTLLFDQTVLIADDGATALLSDDGATYLIPD